MSESVLNNGQFRIDPLNVLIALLISIAIGKSLSSDQAAVTAAVFPHMILALNHIRR